MNLQVIIVDDDPVIRILHRTLVRKSGLDAEPLFFENGQNLWEYIREQDLKNPRPLLILLDLQMPSMSGFEFLDQLEKHPQNGPIYVIMLLSSVNRSDEIKASKYRNVIGYIEKPLNLKTLEQVKNLEKLQPYY